MRLSIVILEPEDWPAIEAIDREGIATGHATFETATPSRERFEADHADRCRDLVVLERRSKSVGAD
jgi:phosphinothricin acetyltransferase